MPRLRRRGGLESGEAEARLPVLRDRVARRSSTHDRHDRRARSRRARCAASATTRAAGRPRSGRSSARAATRSRCSIRSGRRRTANSAARRSSCPTRRPSPRSGPRACCRSRSARTARATASAQWYGKLWLAPVGAEAPRADRHGASGVYLPYWTFDAHVDAPWTAEAGHYYYTTETYSEKAARRGRAQVQHVRWEPAAGRLSHFFDDDLVCASVGVHPELLRGIEPFPTQDRSSPTTRATSRDGSSSATRSISSPPRSARATAMDAKVQALCAQQIPGDTLSQPRRAQRLFAADVQAHPRAGVAHDVHVRRARVPVRA